ncbi:unnamed protein product, partial [Prorocentrum cordatum]
VGAEFGAAVGAAQSGRCIGAVMVARENFNPGNIYLEKLETSELLRWGRRGIGMLEDLQLQSVRMKVLEAIDARRSRPVIAQLPRAPRAPLNRGINWKDRPEAPASPQDGEPCFLTFTEDILNNQILRGSRALLEDPALADSRRGGA